MTDRVSPYLERPLRTLEQALEARTAAATGETADTAAALVRWLQGGAPTTPGAVPGAKPDRPRDPASLRRRRAA